MFTSFLESSTRCWRLPTFAKKTIIGSNSVRNGKRCDLEYIVLAPSYFCHERLSSPLAGLTSLFGMGRGVAPPSKHQNIIFKVI